VFIKTLKDLKDPVILDGIDCRPGGTQYRIHTHDFYGPLPNINFRLKIDEDDEAFLLGKVNIETCKLGAISQARFDLASYFPLCQFHLPAKKDGKSVVGITIGSNSYTAESHAFWQAYLDLKRKVVM